MDSTLLKNKTGNINYDTKYKHKVIPGLLIIWNHKVKFSADIFF